MLELVDHAIGILYPPADAIAFMAEYCLPGQRAARRPRFEATTPILTRHISIQSGLTDLACRRPICEIVQSLFCRLLAHSQSENAMKPITAGATKIGAGIGRHNQTTIATVIRRKK